MRVYISGVYSAPTVEERLANTRRAMDAYLTLIQKGYVPFCPHLSHFAHEYALTQGIEISYEDWMRLDLAEVKKSDILLSMSSSPGADREEKLARDLLHPVFKSLEEILKTYGDPYGVYP